jgi:undecaprenol kinase
MNRIQEKLSHPIRGLAHVLLNDRGMQAVLLIGGVGILLLQHYFGPISDNGNLLLTLAFFLVVITELQNSALETALDKVHPDRHADIGRSKDIAAAAVLCATVFSLVCAYYVATGKI